jgi:hypothetical protein
MSLVTFLNEARLLAFLDAAVPLLWHADGSGHEVVLCDGVEDALREDGDLRFARRAYERPTVRK